MGSLCCKNIIANRTTKSYRKDKKILPKKTVKKLDASKKSCEYPGILRLGSRRRPLVPASEELVLLLRTRKEGGERSRRKNRTRECRGKRQMKGPGGNGDVLINRQISMFGGCLRIRDKWPHIRESSCIFIPIRQKHKEKFFHKIRKAALYTRKVMCYNGLAF